MTNNNVFSGLSVDTDRSLDSFVSVLPALPAMSNLSSTTSSSSLEKQVRKTSWNRTYHLQWKKNRWSVDRTDQMSFVFHQEEVPCCVCASLVQLFYMQMDSPPFLCSVRYLYYHVRKEMNRLEELCGTNLPVALHAIQKYGMVPEDLCPYDKGRLSEVPSEECYRFAERFPWRVHAIRIPFRSISQALSRSFLVYCTIRRYADQYVDPCSGVLCTPSIQCRRAAGHALVLVGIDVRQECCRFVDSHGTISPRTGGTLLIPWRDMSFLVRDMVAIRVQWTRLWYPSLVVRMLRRREASLEEEDDFLETNTIEESSSLMDFRLRSTIPPLFFHHVILGAGVSGRYLAFRLQRQFPHHRILLVEAEEKGTRYGSTSTVGDSGHPLYLEHSAYRVRLDTMPCLRGVLDRHTRRSMMATDHETTPSFSVLPFVQNDREDMTLPPAVQRLQKALCVFLRVECLSQVQIISVLQSPSLCAMSFMDWIRATISLTDWEKKQISKFLGNTNLWIERISFPVTFANLCHDLTPPYRSRWISIRWSEVMEAMVKDFLPVVLPDLATSTEDDATEMSSFVTRHPHMITFGVQGNHSSSDKELGLLHLRLSAPCQSDGLVVQYGHLYQTGSQWPLSFGASPVTIPRITMYLWPSPSYRGTQPKGTQWIAGIGRIVWNHHPQGIIKIVLSEDATVRAFRDHGPTWRCNGMFYPVVEWPFLYQWLSSYDDVFKVGLSSCLFSLYQYPDSALTALSTISKQKKKTNHTTLWSIWKQQTGLESENRIHYIDRGQLFGYCFAEGALQNVHTFLSFLYPRPSSEVSPFSTTIVG